MDGRTYSSNMALEQLDLNAETLENELNWFSEVIKTRFNLYFGEPSEWKDVLDIPPPNLEADPSLYASLLRHYAMNPAERIIVLLGIIPHVRPQALDLFYLENSSTKRGYTEFGGINGNFHSGFIPTGETAAFLIAGNDIRKRFSVFKLFKENHFFHQHNILTLNREQNHKNEPDLSAAIALSKEYLTYLTTGENFKPDYTTDFPAKLIHTPLEWDDLVLEHHVREEIDDIVTWIEHGTELMEEWKLKNKVKRGYRAMFFGPPGTGKTLTACLIGKSLGLDVYRIDLSMVVSKYIGETEKNLSSVFDQAEHKNWILFFDEADALFGKRTQTSSSNDRHANQEIAYLLQRIEDFPGVILLASNLRGNLDEAFSRRFQSMIYFPIPNEEQRLELWQRAFEAPIQLHQNVDLDKIARTHSITGGAITNVLRYCAIKAKQKGGNTVGLLDIEQGIRNEFNKEGRG